MYVLSFIIDLVYAGPKKRSRPNNDLLPNNTKQVKEYQLIYCLMNLAVKLLSPLPALIKYVPELSPEQSISV